MSRRQKDPLRPLIADERRQVERVSRSQTEPVVPVARTKTPLAVAAGQSFTEAARSADRRSGDAVAHLVGRFNWDGVSPLERRHGGG